jgi:hypothetical protein
MKIKIPNRIFGAPIPKDAIEKALAKQNSPNPVQTTPQYKGNISLEQFKTLKFPSNIDLSQYIWIPGTNKIIGKREILHNENWANTHSHLNEQGLFMPTQTLFMPYFVSVLDAEKRPHSLYNALGSLMPKNEITDLYKYLTSDHREGCWTHLDFLVRDKNNTEHAFYNHRIEYGNIVAKTQEPLNSPITEDCLVSLDFNNQGLPTNKSALQKYKQGENIYFYHPINDAVAWFVAGSSGAGLYRSVGPSVSYSSLGVFPCAEGTRAPQYQEKMTKHKKQKQ